MYTSHSLHTYSYMKDESNELPEAATSATGLCCSCDINPITEKITKPANKLVPELTQHTISESLKQKCIEFMKY